MTKKQEAIVNFLIGQVMKRSPSACPRIVRGLVVEALEARCR